MATPSMPAPITLPSTRTCGAPLVFCGELLITIALKPLPAIVLASAAVLPPMTASLKGPLAYS